MRNIVLSFVFVLFLLSCFDETPFEPQEKYIGERLTSRSLIRPSSPLPYSVSYYYYYGEEILFSVTNYTDSSIESFLTHHYQSDGNITNIKKHAYPSGELLSYTQYRYYPGAVGLEEKREYSFVDSTNKINSLIVYTLSPNIPSYKTVYGLNMTDIREVTYYYHNQSNMLTNTQTFSNNGADIWDLPTSPWSSTNLESSYTFVSYKIFLYDNEANLTNESTYSASGILLSEIDYKYKTNDDIDTAYYVEDNSLKEIVEYEYENY